MTRSVRLMLLRHGQTTSNVSGVLDTSSPGPNLTDLGHRQANAAARVLASENYQGIYVSDLIRTHQTAAPIEQTGGLAARRQSGLEEIHAGNFEMCADAEAVDGYLGTVAEWVRGNLGLTMPGSETGHEFVARYDAAIARITDQIHEHAREPAALVVSHGAAIRTWVASRIPESGEHPEATKMLDNTACITLEGHPESGWELIDWNSEPIGGFFLEDQSAQDPTRQPVGD